MLGVGEGCLLIHPSLLFLEELVWVVGGGGVGGDIGVEQASKPLFNDFMYILSV